jgi:lysylphosphatidylglycerol synthetase-like protein (DUF2156 family)
VKRNIPLMIAMLGGLIMIIQYFIPHQASQDVFNYYTEWAPLVGSFALILGVGSLTRVHMHKIRLKGRNWQFSLAVLIPLYLMPVFAMLPTVVGGGTDGPGFFDFMYSRVQIPIQATMFSMLAFYIASAAFRAFRAKSILATVLLVTAVIVMLAQVPVGELFGRWLPETGQWILRFPNLAAKRAIELGVGFGMLATCLKIIFGVERGWLGGAGD